MNFLDINFDELRIDSIGSWPSQAKLLTCIMVFTAVLILGYFLQISAKIEELNTSETRVITMSATYSDTFRQVSNLDSYRAELEEIKKNLAELASLLPHSSEEAEVLQDLSAEASNCGLDFIGVKPGKPSSKSFYNVDPLEFTLAGSYFGLGQFVSNVASMPRIVTLHDFVITGDKNGGPQLTMVVTAKTYWAPLAAGGQ